MQPTVVMRALKEEVEARLERGEQVQSPGPDPVKQRLELVVGSQWVTNDAAILLCYADDPFPFSPPRLPAWVVLPRTTEEVESIMNIVKEEGLPWAVRGNGASVYGLVFSSGLVLDMTRMKGIKVDTGNWWLEAEAGVTAFEAQQAAWRHGCRINTAEPAATMCGNALATGIFSTWFHAYGLAADNVIDATFVDEAGHSFFLHDPAGPKFFVHRPDPFTRPRIICTKATFRMFPVTEDEEGLLVPFGSFAEALGLAQELATRRIGVALAVLGEHFLSTFLSPTQALAEQVKETLSTHLNLHSAVFLIGDVHAREAVKKMTPTIIDDSTFRSLMLGLPQLTTGEWGAVLRDTPGDEPLFAMLFQEEMRSFLDLILEPSPEHIATAVDNAELKDFYRELYARPEMTDPVWLNMFRIVSSRMARHKHVIAFVLYLPLEKALVQEVMTMFSDIAETYGVDHAFGFLTPLDFGKRVVFEYDYYLDQTSAEEKKRLAPAMQVVEQQVAKLIQKNSAIKPMSLILGQGLARKEQFLYQ